MSENTDGSADANTAHSDDENFRSGSTSSSSSPSFCGISEDDEYVLVDTPLTMSIPLSLSSDSGKGLTQDQGCHGNPESQGQDAGSQPGQAPESTDKKKGSSQIVTDNQSAAAPCASRTSKSPEDTKGRDGAESHQKPSHSFSQAEGGAMSSTNPTPGLGNTEYEKITLKTIAGITVVKYGKQLIRVSSSALQKDCKPEIKVSEGAAYLISGNKTTKLIIQNNRLHVEPVTVLQDDVHGIESKRQDAGHSDSEAVSHEQALPTKQDDEVESLVDMVGGMSLNSDVKPGFGSVKNKGITEPASTHRSQRREVLKGQTQGMISSEAGEQQRSQQTDQRSQQADQRSQQTDQRSQQADQRSQQTDQRSQQADQRSQQTDQRSQQADQIDQRSQQNDQRSQQADQRSQQTDQRSQQADQRSQQTDQRSQQADQRSQQADQRSQQADQTDQRSQQTDQRSQQADQRSQQADQRSQQADQRSQQTDQRSQQADQRSQQTDQRSQQTDQRSQQTDQRSQQADQRSQQTDRRSQQTDRRSQQADRRSQQADRRSQQTDRRSQQADQRSQQTDQRSQQTDQKSQQIDQRSQQTNRRSQQTDQRSQQTERRSQQTDQKSQQADQRSQQTDQRSQQTDQRSQQTDQRSQQTDQRSQQTNQRSQQQQTDQRSQQTDQRSQQTDQKSQQTDQRSQQTDQRSQQADLPQPDFESQQHEPETSQSDPSVSAQQQHLQKPTKEAPAQQQTQVQTKEDTLEQHQRQKLTKANSAQQKKWQESLQADPAQQQHRQEQTKEDPAQQQTHEQTKTDPLEEQQRQELIKANSALQQQRQEQTSQTPAQQQPYQTDPAQQRQRQAQIGPDPGQQRERQAQIGSDPAQQRQRQAQIGSDPAQQRQRQAQIGPDPAQQSRGQETTDSVSSQPVPPPRSRKQQQQPQSSSEPEQQVIDRGFENRAANTNQSSRDKGRQPCPVVVGQGANQTERSRETETGAGSQPAARVQEENPKAYELPLMISYQQKGKESKEVLQMLDFSLEDYMKWQFVVSCPDRWKNIECLFQQEKEMEASIDKGTWCVRVDVGIVPLPPDNSIVSEIVQLILRSTQDLVVKEFRFSGITGNQLLEKLGSSRFAAFLETDPRNPDSLVAVGRREDVSALSQEVQAVVDESRSRAIITAKIPIRGVDGSLLLKMLKDSLRDEKAVSLQIDPLDQDALVASYPENDRCKVMKVIGDCVQKVRPYFRMNLPVFDELDESVLPEVLTTVDCFNKMKTRFHSLSKLNVEIRHQQGRRYICKITGCSEPSLDEAVRMATECLKTLKRVTVPLPGKHLAEHFIDSVTKYFKSKLIEAKLSTHLFSDVKRKYFLILGKNDYTLKEAQKLIQEGLITKEISSFAGNMEKMKVLKEQLETNSEGLVCIDIDVGERSFSQVTVCVTGIKPFVQRAVEQIHSSTSTTDLPKEAMKSTSVTQTKVPMTAVQRDLKKGNGIPEETARAVPVDRHANISTATKSDSVEEQRHPLRQDDKEIQGRHGGQQDESLEAGSMGPYAVEKSTWTFSSGHAVLMMKCDVSECGADRKVQPESDDMKKQGARPKGYIQLNVPLWKGGKDKDKSTLRDRVATMLGDIRGHGAASVGFQVQPVQKWPYSKYFKMILMAVQEYLTTGKDMIPTTVMLCTSDSKQYTEGCEMCAAGLQGVAEPLDLPGTNSGSDNERHISITVTRGSLAETQADVLVNTTDKFLQLDNGAVSKALLAKAGKKLQQECNTRYPRGINYRDIAVTQGYGLKCNHVFHGALAVHQATPNGGSSLESIENIRQFVATCLVEASGLKCRTIAFPTLGTGNLGYPPDMVAAEMVTAVDKFSQEMPTSTVQAVLFVIYPTDTNCISWFEKIVKKREKLMATETSGALCYGSVSVNCVQGAIKDVAIKCQCLLYLWEKDHINSVFVKNNRLLKLVGGKVQKEWNDKFRQSRVNFKPLCTDGGELPNSVIVHMPCTDKGGSEYQAAITEGLQLADERNMTSVIIPFPLGHSFVRRARILSSAVIEGVRQASSTLKNVHHVILSIEGQANFKPCEEVFSKHLKGQAAKIADSSPAAISDRKDEYEEDKTDHEQRSRTSQSTKDAQQKPDKEQNQDSDQSSTDDESGTDSRNKEWGLQSLHATSSEHQERCLILSGVAALDQTSKIEIMLYYADLRVSPPVVEVPYKEQTEALLIFKSKEDAESAFEQKSKLPKGYTFGQLEPQDFTWTEAPIKQSLVKVAMQKDKLQDMKNELERCGVAISSDRSGKYVIKGPTVSILEKAQRCLFSFATTQLQLKISEPPRSLRTSECERIDKFDNISTLMYAIFQEVKRDELEQFKRDCSLSLSHDSSTNCVIIESHHEQSRSALSNIENVLGCLRSATIDEVVIPVPEGIQRPSVQKLEVAATEMAWKEDQSSGCVFLPSRKAVFAVGDTYEGMKKISHQFLVKIGVVKLTGKTRGRRHLDTSATVEQVETTVKPHLTTNSVLRPTR